MLLRACLLSLSLLLAGCVTAQGGRPDAASANAATAAMQGDAARPASTTGWVRSELYFGVGAEGDPGSAIDETAWRAFLDREVTPRFPDGLTVIDAYGQWQFRGRPAPERLTSKVLVILHADTAARRADIEAIRLAWKQATRHQSVLWSQQPATVSF